MPLTRYVRHSNLHWCHTLTSPGCSGHSAGAQLSSISHFLSVYVNRSQYNYDHKLYSPFDQYKKRMPNSIQLNIPYLCILLFNQSCSLFVKCFNTLRNRSFRFIIRLIFKVGSPMAEIRANHKYSFRVTH